MDAGINDEYAAWLHRYLFPRFTDPAERVLGIKELFDCDDGVVRDDVDDGGDDDGGDGGGSIRAWCG